MIGVAVGGALWTFAVVCGLLVVGCAVAAVQRDGWLRRWARQVVAILATSRSAWSGRRGRRARGRGRSAGRRSMSEFEFWRSCLPDLSRSMAATGGSGGVSTGASDEPDPSHSPGAGWVTVPPPAEAGRGGRGGVIGDVMCWHGDLAVSGSAVHLAQRGRPTGPHGCDGLPRAMSADGVGSPSRNATVNGPSLVERGHSNEARTGRHAASDAPRLSGTDGEMRGAMTGSCRRSHPASPRATVPIVPGGRMWLMSELPSGRGCSPTPRPPGSQHGRCVEQASATRGTPTALSVAVCARDTLEAPSRCLGASTAGVFPVARAVAPPPDEAARATRKPIPAPGLRCR